MKKEEELLKGYLINLIKISADILRDIDNFELEKVEEVGKIVSSLDEWRFKNDMLNIPF